VCPVRVGGCCLWLAGGVRGPQVRSLPAAFVCGLCASQGCVQWCDAAGALVYMSLYVFSSFTYTLLLLLSAACTF
jgi:hypothetical protein